MKWTIRDEQSCNVCRKLIAAWSFFYQWCLASDSPSAIRASNICLSFGHTSFLSLFQRSTFSYPCLSISQYPFFLVSYILTPSHSLTHTSDKFSLFGPQTTTPASVVPATSNVAYMYVEHTLTIPRITDTCHLLCSSKFMFHTFQMLSSLVLLCVLLL